MDPDPEGAAVERRRTVWWLLVFVYTAILVRSYGPYPHVFGGEEVAFQGNDAWYHMRLIDQLAANFPHRTPFDPYAIYPAGQEVSLPPLLGILIAGVAWLLGFGSPSQGLVELVAAWFPPVLGALTTIFVYLIGRQLFDRRAGLIAAGLLAVQPGQFLLRSLLGFVDHHVAEALLSTVTVYLILLALERAERCTSGARGGPVWRAAALAGLGLGAYLLSWGGGSLFVALLVLWLVAHSVLEHLRGRADPGRAYPGRAYPGRAYPGRAYPGRAYPGRAYSGLGRVALPMALVAGLCLVPFGGVLARVELHAAALAALALTPFLLGALSRLTARLGWPRPAFPLLLAGGGVAVWLVIAELFAGFAEGVLVPLRRFLPSALRQTVNEAQPLFARADAPFQLLWEQYRSAFALGLLGLAVFAWRAARRGARPADTLLVVWSLGMFAATLGQNRFGYYLDINLCLLIGLLCALLLAPRHGGGRRLLRAAAALGVALLAFVPTLSPVIDVARAPRGPASPWWESLRWLRETTPEPFGDPAAYLTLHDRPREGESFPYPPQAYGVMAWWDYGYWITRIARRIPVANPTQAGAELAARFFTSTEEEEAARLLDEVGARYVIANSDLGLWLLPQGGSYGFFDALAAWAGEDLRRFYEIVWEADAAGEPRSVAVFYPEFYRAMAVRLYVFGTEAIVPAYTSWVAAIDERPSRNGGTTRVLTEALPFASYEEAVAFLEAHPGGRYRLVGRDPTEPCLPLTPVRGLRQVYPRPELFSGGLPPIRIFERLAPANADGSRLPGDGTHRQGGR